MAPVIVKLRVLLAKDVEKFPAVLWVISLVRAVDSSDWYILYLISALLVFPTCSLISTDTAEATSNSAGISPQPKNIDSFGSSSKTRLDM